MKRRARRDGHAGRAGGDARDRRHAPEGRDARRDAPQKLRRQRDPLADPALLDAVARAVSAVLCEGRRADGVLRGLMRENLRWTAQGRAAVANALHDVLRKWRMLAWQAGVRRATPEPADVVAVLESWRSPPRSAAEHSGGSHARRPPPAVEHSLPDWVDRLGASELGAELWNAFAAYADREPPLYIRVNTLKTDAQALGRRLREECGAAVRRVGWSADALEVRSDANLFATEAHRTGLFEVQDAASQMVARALGAQPGMRVVDGCAGAGGKTLHLAALMRNEGRVLALDPSDEKLGRLRSRARRAGATIVETHSLSTTKVIKRRRGTADRLLLDVPCSGLGVMRRNPDIKWRLKPQDLDRVRTLQREILSTCAPLLRGGGRLVYATCSVLRSEGEDQVRWFLEHEPGAWRLVEQRRWGPPAQDSDAFYLAVLEKAAPAAGAARRRDARS